MTKEQISAFANTNLEQAKQVDYKKPSQADRELNYHRDHKGLYPDDDVTKTDIARILLDPKSFFGCNNLANLIRLDIPENDLFFPPQGEHAGDSFIVLGKLIFASRNFEINETLPKEIEQEKDKKTKTDLEKTRNRIAKDFEDLYTILVNDGDLEVAIKFSWRAKLTHHGRLVTKPKEEFPLEANNFYFTDMENLLYHSYIPQFFTKHITPHVLFPYKVYTCGGFFNNVHRIQQKTHSF